MRFAPPTRRLAIGCGAVVGVFVLGLGSVAWRAADASASPGHSTLLLPEAASSTTTSSTTTSTTERPTTTTSTSTSTSTTVKPAPKPTTPPTTRPRPATTTPTTPRVTEAPPVALPGNFTPEERCATAHQWVVDHGLALPAGWGFRCPGQAVVGGTERWGAACWNCNGDGVSWIAADIARIGASDAALRYVIAHETCHAIDYTTLGITTEVGADVCAALHGAPRPAGSATA